MRDACLQSYLKAKRIEKEYEDKKSGGESNKKQEGGHTQDVTEGWETKRAVPEASVPLVL